MKPAAAQQECPSRDTDGVSGWKPKAMVRRAVAVAAFGLGFVGGTQVGPIWLLSARSVLRRGFVVGLRIVGDAVDRPAARRFGGDRRAPVLRIASCRLGFGIGGAAVLIFWGLNSCCAACRAYTADTSRIRGQNRTAGALRRPAGFLSLWLSY